MGMHLNGATFGFVKRAEVDGGSVRTDQLAADLNTR
jgi:hypothetical protein